MLSKAGQSLLPIELLKRDTGTFDDLIIARAPGTFGELVQGRLGPTPFLITLPINRFSYAGTFSTETPPTKQADLIKCEKLITELHRLLGTQKSIHFQIVSSLPQGKGLASSSADIVALATSILTRIGISRPFHADLISKLARKIEPTDGVMHPGIVAFAHHKVRLIRSLGFLKFKIIGVLEEGTVDSIKYDSKSCAYTVEETNSFEQALKMVSDGLPSKSLEKIGAASTISSEINQRFLPKTNFLKIKKIRKRLKLPGIVVAHSGTAIGLLVPEDHPRTELEKIQSEIELATGIRSELFESYGEGPTICERTPRSFKGGSEPDNYSRIPVQLVDPRHQSNRSLILQRNP